MQTFLKCAALAGVVISMQACGGDDDKKDPKPKPTCTEGERFCNGNEVVECQADGETEVVIDCAVGSDPKICKEESSTVAVCAAPECSADESRCAGSVLQVCSNLRWADDQDCADTDLSCEEDGDTASCVPECTGTDSRCNGAVVQTCQDGLWANTQDCVTTNEQCDDAGGAAACVDVVCDVTAFVSPTIAAFVDTDYRSGGMITASTEVGNEVFVLRLDTRAAVGSTNTVTISGVQTSAATCTNCVSGFVLDAAAGTVKRRLFAQAGSVDFVTFGGDYGDTFHVTMTNLVLREATFATDGTTTSVNGGEHWCLASQDLSATVDYYPCSFEELDLGQGGCSADGAFAVRCETSVDDSPDLRVLSCSSPSACAVGGVFGAECTTSCPTADALQCNGNSVQQCTGGDWLTEELCDAACTGTGASSACPAFTCEANAFTVESATASIDTEVAAGNQIVSVFTTDGSGNKREVRLENYSEGFTGIDPGQTATVTITGAEADYATCGVCVRAFQFDAEDNIVKQFFATSGEVDYVQWPTTYRAPVTIDFSNLVFEEVQVADDFRSVPVPGGHQWCFSAVVATTFADYFPCDESIAVGDAQCNAQNTEVTACLPGDLGDNDIRVIACPGDAAVCTESSTNILAAECLVSCPTNGATQCSGNVIQTCTAGNWITSAFCENGQTCTGGASPVCVDACLPNENGVGRCNGNSIETCNGTLWTNTQDCGDFNTCDDSAAPVGEVVCGPAECSSGENGYLRCAGDMIQTCNGTVWSDGTDCTQTSRECFAPSASTAVCYDTCSSEGTQRCTGNTIESCNGSVFVPGQNCDDTSEVCSEDGLGGASCTT